MRWLSPVPAISTHRSRGRLISAAPPLRSWRRIMIVSLRRPPTSVGVADEVVVVGAGDDALARVGPDQQVVLGGVLDVVVGDVGEHAVEPVDALDVGGARVGGAQHAGRSTDTDRGDDQDHRRQRRTATATRRSDSVRGGSPGKGYPPTSSSMRQARTRHGAVRHSGVGAQVDDVADVDAMRDRTFVDHDQAVRRARRRRRVPDSVARRQLDPDASSERVEQLAVAVVDVGRLIGERPEQLREHGDGSSPSPSRRAPSGAQPTLSPMPTTTRSRAATAGPGCRPACGRRAARRWATSAARSRRRARPHGVDRGEPDAAGEVARLVGHVAGRGSRPAG